MTDASNTDKASGPENPTVIDLEPNEIEPETPPPAPKPPRPSRWRLYGVIATAVIAAVLGAWLYRDYGATWWPSPQMQSLESRVATLEASTKTLNDQTINLASQIDALRQSLTDASNAAKSAEEAKTGLTQLASRLDSAETSVADLRKAIDELHQSLAQSGGTEAPAPDMARVTALEARVAELEKTIAALKTGPGTDAQTATQLSQSLADLKAKLAAGTPYQTEFDRLATLVPAAAGLDTLKNHAAQGIANAAGLAAELGQITASIPGPTAPPVEAEKGYWDSFTNMLGSLVIIRRIGDTDWRTAARKAQEVAAAGDLKAAIEIIDKTEGDKPAAIADWLNRARARLAVEAAAEEVSAAVLRQIAAIGGTP